MKMWGCGEQTNFENIDAEELNKKLGKFYAEATPQHNKKNFIRADIRIQLKFNTIGILFPPFKILDPFNLSVFQDRPGISWATGNKFLCINN